MSAHGWLPRQVVVEVLTAFAVDPVGVVFTHTLSVHLNAAAAEDAPLGLKIFFHESGD